MHTVEVLFSVDCPNAAEAFAMAREAASRLLPACEVRKTPVLEGAQMRGWRGSPTILVDGLDIEGPGEEIKAPACRIYRGSGGLPPPWMIEAGMLRALRPSGILFMCVANSARSQMAEGIARAAAPAGVAIFSAGSRPAPIREIAIRVMGEIGMDISAQKPKAADEIDREAIKAVITLCEEEVCPAWLGAAANVHWKLPDPARVRESEAASLAAFRETRDELRRRIETLFRGWDERASR